MLWPGSTASNRRTIGTTEALPMLEVGTPAPDFTLKSHENEEITLSSFKGDKWVVLHTFPAAFTGG